MHTRENALKEWLKQTINTPHYRLEPLAGDASFRSYYRIYYQGLSQIIMDAPPHLEALESFIHIAGLLAAAKVQVPEIIAINKEQGFLLLSDFGDQLLLNHLNPGTVEQYYKEALQTLSKIQGCSASFPIVPNFDKNYMLKEMHLCPEWFLQKYLSLTLSEEESQIIHQSLEWIANELCLQPLTFIHRDYHSRNLMIVDTAGTPYLGVIDFQDAMLGPFTYDAVSLLKDCYIQWPREKILAWLSFFHQNNEQAFSYHFDDLVRAFDVCGLQRHLKILGIFCRLYLRDKKPGYLHYLPHTLQYVLECTEIYSELHPLFDFFQSRIFLP